MTHPIFTAVTPAEVEAIIRETLRHPLPEAERQGWTDLREEVDDMMHHAPRLVDGYDQDMEEHLAEVAEFNRRFMEEVRRRAAHFLPVPQGGSADNANLEAGISLGRPDLIFLDLAPFGAVDASANLRAYFTVEGAEIFAAYLIQTAAKIKAGTLTQ